MEFTLIGIGILTWITFLPVVGMVIVLLLPKQSRDAIRWTSLGITILQVVLAVVLFTRFDRSLAGINTVAGMQFVEQGDLDRHPERGLVRTGAYRVFPGHRRTERGDGPAHRPGQLHRDDLVVEDRPVGEGLLLRSSCFSIRA